ncbi:hypothetical protein DIPPA_70064 [Diplonema papillatum]|nr:hypothetical protein DIPPA_70064 [Diplonema papillatum]
MPAGLRLPVLVLACAAVSEATCTVHDWGGHLVFSINQLRNSSASLQQLYKLRWDQDLEVAATNLVSQQCAPAFEPTHVHFSPGQLPGYNYTDGVVALQHKCTGACGDYSILDAVNPWWASGSIEDGTAPLAAKQSYSIGCGMNNCNRGASTAAWYFVCLVGPALAVPEPVVDRNMTGLVDGPPLEVLQAHAGLYDCLDASEKPSSLAPSTTFYSYDMPPESVFPTALLIATLLAAVFCVLGWLAVFYFKHQPTKTTGGSFSVLSEEPSEGQQQRPCELNSRNLEALNRMTQSLAPSGSSHTNNGTPLVQFDYWAAQERKYRF